MLFVKKKIGHLQPIDQVLMMLCRTLLLVLSMELIVQAQPEPEAAIDRLFRYDSYPVARNSQDRELVTNLKKWMGAYQRIRKDGDSYVAIFDSGSVPIDAKFKANGSIESVSFGCPISKSLSINDAPANLRTAFSRCAGFKP